MSTKYYKTVQYTLGESIGFCMFIELATWRLLGGRNESNL